MPTYAKRAGVSGTVEEHGVSIASTTASKVDRVMTEAILSFSDASGYLIGETLTEATSGITGVVYWVDLGTDRVGVVDVSGEFTGGEVVTGGTSTTAKTPSGVQNLLNKSADTPRFSIILHEHNLTSAGPGDDQTVLLDEKTEWVVVDIVADATVTVNNDATGNVLDEIEPGEKRAFRNTYRNFQTLLFEFAAAGTCTVLEYNGEENPLTLVEAESSGVVLSSIDGKITQLERTYGYEQPAITDDAQIVHDVSIKLPPKAEYTSPIDFAAAYTSNVTLTLSGLPVTITDAAQIKYIRQVNASNTVFTICNGINGVTFTEASGVITIAGAGTPLASGDVYEVGIDGQRKSYDASSDVTKTQDQSPQHSRWTDWEQFVTSAQDLTGSFATMEKTLSNLTGARHLRAWFELDGNDSRDVEVRIAYETTTGGSDAIPYDPQKWAIRYSSLSTDQKSRVLTGTTGASLDDKFTIEIELDNCSPEEIKIQVKAGTVGATAGQIEQAWYKVGY
jgi:hypothetical protein